MARKFCARCGYPESRHTDAWRKVGLPPPCHHYVEPAPTWMRALTWLLGGWKR
jgi:hypothetical protein